MPTYQILRSLVQDKTFTPVKLTDPEELANVRKIERILDEDGVPTNHTYYRGDIIQSDKKLNDPLRYHEIREHEPNTAEEPNNDAISQMTVPEMRDFAQRNGVDLGEATLKAEIASVCRAACVHILTAPVGSA